MEVNISENSDIVHCVLGNGVDLYVNEGQWLSKCQDSLAERKNERQKKKERKKEEGEKLIFDHVWFSGKTAVLEGAAMYSDSILHVDNDNDADKT